MANVRPDGGQGPQTEQQPHHIADEPVGDVQPNKPKIRSPMTDTGLPVEDQIEKEWDPKKDGGLPTFLGLLWQ